MKAALTAALAMIASPALAAPVLEAWNCRLASGPQYWAIEGDMLVTDMAGLAPAMTRLPIVKNSDEAVLAVSDQYAGRRFEIVLIDKQRLGIKLLTIGLETAGQSSESGVCTSAFSRPLNPSGHAASGTRPVMVSTVRPRIQALLQQAQNLTADGFYDAALVKVRETGAFDRRTPEEDALIAQTRAYILQKSGGKAR